MFGNRLPNVSQTAESGRDTIQVAGNLTVEYAPIDMSYFEIYEEDIKDTIQFFYCSLEGLKDIEFPNNKGIFIEDKNEINNFTNEGFKELEQNSLAYFGKIIAFFRNPGNSMYVDMYNSTVIEVQQIINAVRPSYQNFDAVFPLLYGRLITPYKRTDKEFMRIRKFVYVFLHFMYYNCDIGVKTMGEVSGEGL